MSMMNSAQLTFFLDTSRRTVLVLVKPRANDVKRLANTIGMNHC